MITTHTLKKERKHYMKVNNVYSYEMGINKDFNFYPPF